MKKQVDLEKTLSWLIPSVCGVLIMIAAEMKFNPKTKITWKGFILSMVIGCGIGFAANLLSMMKNVAPDGRVLIVLAFAFASELLMQMLYKSDKKMMKKYLLKAINTLFPD